MCHLALMSSHFQYDAYVSKPTALLTLTLTLTHRWLFDRLTCRVVTAEVGRTSCVHLGFCPEEIVAKRRGSVCGHQVGGEERLQDDSLTLNWILVPGSSRDQLDEIMFTLHCRTDLLPS